MRNRFIKLLSVLLILAFSVGALSSCDIIDGILGGSRDETPSISIKGDDTITLIFDEEITLEYEVTGELTEKIVWEASNSSVYVNQSGKVTALGIGTVTVTVRSGDAYDSVLIKVVDSLPPSGDGSDNTDTDNGENNQPGGDINDGSANEDESDKNNGDDEKDEVIIPPDKYVNMSWDEFYSDYEPALSLEDALLRSEMGFMSGDITVPDPAPVHAAYQPKVDGMYVRSTDSVYYDNGNTYVVFDAYGREVTRIYRGGGYITIEEVAAYLYAFGEIPANYDSNKNNKTISKSPKAKWGKYLRLNDSQFSGDTSRYPYEPELPDISGCGGSLRYNEIDVGTTKGYNNGTKISRNTARFVYVKSRYSTKITDPNERYVFYTYNHYNDFTEYLNYYGGWGQIFGNETGGGEYNDKYNPKPTPYPEVYREGLLEDGIVAAIFIPFILTDKEHSSAF